MWTKFVRRRFHSSCRAHAALRPMLQMSVQQLQLRGREWRLPSPSSVTSCSCAGEKLLSESFKRGRCRRGRSRIPRGSGKPQLSAPALRTKGENKEKQREEKKAPPKMNKYEEKKENSLQPHLHQPLRVLPNLVIK